MNLSDFNDTDAFIQTVQHRLNQFARRKGYLVDDSGDPRRISSVLFLLAHSRRKAIGASSPSVVMNLRSALVRQPGDMCCPGGGLSLGQDRLIARFLRLPISPLAGWPFWLWWRRHYPKKAKHLALLYAAALREGFEEMRLNPFGVTFLGALPPQNLVMFKRVIYPQVAWIKRQKHFFPNWEVERVVYLPLAELLNPSNYACYRLRMSFDDRLPPSQRKSGDFLCYLHHHSTRTDVLWGATLRITMDFLKITFGFTPPNPAVLPVVEGQIDDTYIKSG